jgi:putative heme transporter
MPGSVAPGTEPVEHAAPSAPGPEPMRPVRRWWRPGAARRALRRSWPVLRYVLGLALAGVVLWVLAGHRGELHGTGTVFDHLRWWWILPAVVLELASLAAFAVMQRRLLSAGDLRAPTAPLAGTVFAAQSITNSVPAGPAVAYVYQFRWFRRFGADDTLAAWALIGTGVAAAVSLALVAAAGAALATGEGASLDLIWVIVGVLVVTVAVGALFVYERPLVALVSWVVRASRRLTGRPHGEVANEIQRVLDRVMAVRLGWRGVGTVVGWGVVNWVLDCACFALSFLAVGAGIPAKGLLLAYGAGQLAANFPITPGGLGAVEGSITIALVAFGGASASTVDAVLVYRLISFWFVLVLGWVAWAVLALGVRRGRWPRRALESTVEVGIPEQPGWEGGPRIAPIEPMAAE